MQAELIVESASGGSVSHELSPGPFAVADLASAKSRIVDASSLEAEISCVWNTETNGLLWRDPESDSRKFALLEPNHSLQIKGATIRFKLSLAPPAVDGLPFEKHALYSSQTYIYGRAPEAQEEPSATTLVALDGMARSISKTHATLKYSEGSWWISDCSSSQTLHNGIAIDREPLVFGDRFKIGPYVFEFRGESIDRVDHVDTGCVRAENLSVIVKDRVTGKPLPILTDVTVNIETGRFIGILGGSGQGKSTLLNALCGIRPADKGTVTIGGIDNGLLNRIRPGLVGFVPQDDIVHTELVVRDAFILAAKLRLRLADKERETLVDNTIRHLGLADHASKRVSYLSGGQRKRVSIGIELLSKPAVIFLDEPSSGLDPTTEESLMELLQSLTKTNLTVVCTTHVLQKAYLFHRLIFIHGGRLIFEGNSSVAREFFLQQVGTENTASVTASRSSQEVMKTPLEKIYSQVLKGDQSAASWEEKFLKWSGNSKNGSAPSASDSKVSLPANDKRVPAISRFLTLLVRQRKILAADWLNLAFLFCQVILIGLLIAFVSDEFGFRMFLGLIATMWFGCSNGAQQIVSELPILKREQVCGLGRNVYLSSKFFFQSYISCAQGLLLFLIIIPLGYLFHPIDFDEENFQTLYEMRIAPAMGMDEFGAAEDEDEPFVPISDDSDFPETEASVNTAPESEKPAEEGPGALKRFFIAPPYWMAETVAKWFVMEDSFVESGETPITDSNGNPVIGQDGKPMRFPAIPVWKVLLTGVFLKLGAFAGAALVGVSLGLAVSAWVRTPTQAVMWVPLLLIPQILFGGYVVTLPKMSAIVRNISVAFPSHACQRIIDVSNLYGRATPFVTNLTKNPIFLTGAAEPEEVSWQEDGSKVSESFDRESYVNTSWQNLAVDPSKLGQHKIVEELAGTDSYGTEIRRKRDTVKERRDVRYSKGTPYLFTFPALVATWILIGWIALCYIAALFGIRGKTQS